MNRKTSWDNDDMLWAMQVYDDPFENNNSIYQEEHSAIRWGEGVPEWMVDDYPKLLKAFRTKYPNCGPNAWVDWSTINRLDDEDDGLYAKLWVCRNYGTGAAAPPEGMWYFLGSYALPPEQECIYDHADDKDKDACQLCEGSGHIYHGDGYAMQVWAEVTSI